MYNMDLINAARNGNETRVRFLLENEADVDIRETDGMTALMWSSYNGYSGIVRILLDVGADVDIQNENGWAAIHCASRFGHTYIVELLLNHGANVDIQDIYNWTSLMWSSHSGYIDVTILLLRYGADVDIQNENGWAALHCATMKGNKEIIELLLEHGADVNIQDNDGKTALMMAAEKGYIKIVRLLLDNGSNVNIRNNRGKTSYDLATDEIKNLIDEWNSMLFENYKGYPKGLISNYFRSNKFGSQKLQFSKKRYVAIQKENRVLKGTIKPPVKRDTHNLEKSRGILMKKISNNKKSLPFIPEIRMNVPLLGFGKKEKQLKAKVPKKRINSVKKKSLRLTTKRNGKLVNKKVLSKQISMRKKGERDTVSFGKTKHNNKRGG